MRGQCFHGHFRCATTCQAIASHLLAMGAMGWSWYGCTCRNIWRQEAIWLRSWEAWSCYVCIYLFLGILLGSFLIRNTPFSDLFEVNSSGFVLWFFKDEEGMILWQDLTLGISWFPWQVCLVSEMLPRAQTDWSFGDATSHFFLKPLYHKLQLLKYCKSSNTTSLVANFFHPLLIELSILHQKPGYLMVFSIWCHYVSHDLYLGFYVFSHGR